MSNLRKIVNIILLLILFSFVVIGCSTNNPQPVPVTEEEKVAQAFAVLPYDFWFFFQFHLNSLHNSSGVIWDFLSFSNYSKTSSVKSITINEEKTEALLVANYIIQMDYAIDHGSNKHISLEGDGNLKFIKKFNAWELEEVDFIILKNDKDNSPDINGSNVANPQLIDYPDGKVITLGQSYHISGTVKSKYDSNTDHFFLISGFYTGRDCAGITTIQTLDYTKFYNHEIQTFPSDDPGLYFNGLLAFELIDTDPGDAVQIDLKITLSCSSCKYVEPAN
ncbi:MAG TPA: hypothetical protein VHY08_04610 [Bacillota bacterium]|nr:hypothetical protein [Bacillota bacterium]